MTTLPTSSPTLTSDGESAILQWIVNEGHLLASGDLKTASLSGDPDPAYKGSDALYIDPPSDLKRWLTLGPEDVLRLRKGILRPHQRTSSMASKAQPSPPTSWLCVNANGPLCLDSPCVQSCETRFSCRCANQMESSRCRFLCVTCSWNSHGPLETTEECPRCVLESMLTIWSLVEILLFRKLCNGFGLNFAFGTWEQSRFRFRGRELCQEYNRKCIKISMSKFVQEMEPVSDPKHLKDDLDAPLEANVHSQFRAGVGQLQWLQMQGNPLLSFATGILQSRSATPNGHDLLSLNKLMRDAKSMPDLCWWIVSVPSSFVWLTAADAAWANRPDGSSTSGHVIMAAHPNNLRGESSTVSVLAWTRVRYDEL